MANINNNEKILSLEEEMANAIDDAPKIDDDESDLADSYKLPDDDLSNESLDIRVVPKKDNEFTCKNCNLIFNKRNMSKKKGKENICIDCEQDL